MNSTFTVCEELLNRELAIGTVGFWNTASFCNYSPKSMVDAFCELYADTRIFTYHAHTDPDCMAALAHHQGFAWG